MPTIPTYPGVYIQEVPSVVRTIEGVPTSVTVFVGPTTRGRSNHPRQVFSMEEFGKRFGGLSSSLETGYAVRQFFLNGGLEAWVVRVAKTAGLANFQAAFQSLKSTDFNLLVLPGVTNPAILAAAAAFSEERRAFLLVDSPVTGAKGADPVGEMVAARQGTALPKSRNAAVFFPWMRIPDPLKPAAFRLVPPSGSIAGLYARTDIQRGVWKAPAGSDAQLRGAAEAACPMTDAQNGVLNPLAVNCVRAFKTHVVVCWGSRTLEGADGIGSEWKYVPVRRLGLYIEESLFRGTQWAVFEPNDEPLWSQLRLNIGAFLNVLFRQGAFAGATQREAYFVRCDSQTTTQTDINRGIVNIDVGFAPLKPAEFVILRLRQKAAQAAT